jgi:hypothetical protein
VTERLKQEKFVRRKMGDSGREERGRGARERSEESSEGQQRESEEGASEDRAREMGERREARRFCTFRIAQLLFNIYNAGRQRTTNARYCWAMVRLREEKRG